ncbi:MAG TPA: AbrB family transcriptional regulator, partial [Deltaproteobacteria bacterium]|nr:AbrB family transcriptional regulator [Deltaproteobacteria bacterium]
SEATLTSKGQITLPIDIRKALSLRSGDRIAFILEGPGRVRIEPTTLSVKELKGALRSSRSKPVSLQEMKQAI